MYMRYCRSLAFLIAVFFLSDSHLHAQQRRSKREQKREFRQQKKRDTPAAAPQRAARSYPASEFKERYRVAVLLPLYLDELVQDNKVTFKGNVPAKAMAGSHYYQGIEMAADSLRRSGVKMDLFIHDITAADGSPEQLVGDGKLDSVDLIIGAVEQLDIPVLAELAQRRHINFVSVLSTYDGGVKGNPYFTMLLPSVRTHCEQLTDELSGLYESKKVVMLYRTTSLADENAALYLLNDTYSKVRYRKLLCNTPPSRKDLLKVIDTTKPNVVVVPIHSPTLADSLLHALTFEFPTTHFEVYGMPTWSGIHDLNRPGSHSNLAVHVTSAFYAGSPDGPLLNSLAKRYTKEFGGEGDETMLQGYEAMLWYGTLLRQYGTIFNDHYKDAPAAPFTRFRIKPRKDGSNVQYFENRNVYHFIFQGGVSEVR